MSCWNNIDCVNRWNSIAQIATAVLTILAAVAGSLILVTSSRLETLKAGAAMPRVERLRANQEAVSRRISRVPPTPIRIETALGDLEAVGLAKELLGILKAAGWQADRIDQSTHSLEFLDGIVVTYEPSSASAAGLARGLEAAGIGAVSRRDAMTSGVVVRIGAQSESGRRRTCG